MENTQMLDKIIDISQDKEKSEFSPKQIVDSLLTLLPSRESNILSLRCGFNENKPQTLDAIGQRMNLTRERVRQIEKQALKKISKNNKIPEILAPLRHLVKDILEKHGDLISLENFVQELLSLTPNKDEEFASRFLINKFLDNQIELFKDKDFKPSLKANNLPIEFVTEVLNELQKIFESKNKILKQKEITKLFSESEYYKIHQEKFSKYLEKNENDLGKIVLSYLSASSKFTKTPLEQWGLTGWEVVKPRRVNGKIYLVFLAHQKPLHFEKISKIINETWKDSRPTKAATVHNELIADSRFSLAGRGIYGLKEWGFDDSKVDEIVQDILKANPNLSTQEIVDKVKAKKMVKDSTIKMAIRKYRKE